MGVAFSFCQVSAVWPAARAVLYFRFGIGFRRRFRSRRRQAISGANKAESPLLCYSSTAVCCPIIAFTQERFSLSSFFSLLLLLRHWSTGSPIPTIRQLIPYAGLLPHRWLPRYSIPGTAVSLYVSYPWGIAYYVRYYS